MTPWRVRSGLAEVLDQFFNAIVCKWLEKLLTRDKCNASKLVCQWPGFVYLILFKNQLKFLRLSQFIKSPHTLLNLPCHRRYDMILQILPYILILNHRHNSVLSQQAPDPIPESSRICGGWVVPAQRMTSFLAFAVYSSPFRIRCR